MRDLQLHHFLSYVQCHTVAALPGFHGQKDLYLNVDHNPVNASEMCKKILTGNKL